MKRIIWIAFAICIITAACNKPNEFPGNTESGDGSKSSEVGTQAVYPHSAEFKVSGKVHGRAFFSDQTKCKTCHGTESPKSGVSCKKCHDFPHESHWAVGRNHGSAYLSDYFEDDAKKQRVSCESCHSKESKFNERHPKEFLDCKTCHVFFPHDDEIFSEHMDLARTDPGACLHCHESIKEHNEGYEGCLGCHTGKLVPTWVEEPETALNSNKPKAYQHLKANAFQKFKTLKDAWDKRVNRKTASQKK